MSEDDGQIQVLTGLEGVRRRPGMYVGDTTDGSGLHQLIWEVVGNVIDLHLARNATELHVEMTPDSWVTVRDDGPGIPVDLDPSTNMTTLERVLTQLHLYATYDGHFPHLHVGNEMYGVGLVAVNALSTRLDIETTRDGVRWAQSFERGEPTSELRRLGASSVEGTAIRFHPDPEIFGAIDLDLAKVGDRLQQLAWLNPFLKVSFQEQRLRWRGGLRGWVTELAAKHGKIEALYTTSQTADGVHADIAIGWSSSAGTTIRSFVNMQETLGGTHEDGLWQGLVEYVRTLGVSDPAAAVRERLAPGLVAVLHVGLYGPTYANPTKDHLTTPIAAAAVGRILETDLLVALQHDRRLYKAFHGRLGLLPSGTE